MAKKKTGFSATANSRQLRDRKELILAAQEVAEKAQALGIDVALIGGLALQLHGSDRLTSDIDFVADKLPPEWYEITGKLPGGGDALRGPNDVPTDWIFRRTDAYQALYQEALLKSVTDRKTSLPVATPEYIGAMKMQAARKKDVSDLEWLISQEWFDRAKFTRIVQKHLGPYAVDRLPGLFRDIDWNKQEGTL